MAEKKNATASKIDYEGIPGNVLKSKIEQALSIVLPLDFASRFDDVSPGDQVCTVQDGYDTIVIKKTKTGWTYVKS